MIKIIEVQRRSNLMEQMENEVLKQIRERKSVRVFLDRPVEKEEKDKIIDAAMQAPTAGNQQMYTILDITDPGLKQELSVLCDNQPFIAKAPLVLVFLADCRKWMDIYRAADMDPRPAGYGDLILALADTCIAAQNSVTAAWSMGIGSCYIGDVLENCEKMREALKLPQYVLPAAMVVYGYPTEQQKNRRKPARFERDYIVQENTYHDNTREIHQKAIEKRAENDGRRDFDFDYWVKAFGMRKYESDFSREMSRSAEVYMQDYKTKDR